MGRFEDGAAARSMLELEMQRIEKRNKEARGNLSEAEIHDAEATRSKIDALAAKGVISPAFAEDCSKRVSQTACFDELDRRELRDVTNGLENPLERGKRYFDSDTQRTMARYRQSIQERREPLSRESAPRMPSASPSKERE